MNLFDTPLAHKASEGEASDSSLFLHFFILICTLRSVFVFYSKSFTSSLSGSVFRFVSLSIAASSHTLLLSVVKNRGLNGMVLYLAVRCAITQDRLDRDRTIGQKIEVCHILCVSSSCLYLFFLSLPSFCVPLSCLFACLFTQHSQRERRLDSSCGDYGQTSTIIWTAEPLQWFESASHLLTLSSLT